MQVVNRSTKSSNKNIKCMEKTTHIKTSKKTMLNFYTKKLRDFSKTENGEKTNEKNERKKRTKKLSEKTNEKTERKN